MHCVTVLISSILGMGITTAAFAQSQGTCVGISGCWMGEKLSLPDFPVIEAPSTSIGGTYLIKAANLCLDYFRTRNPTVFFNSDSWVTGGWPENFLVRFDSNGSQPNTPFAMQFRSSTDGGNYYCRTMQYSDLKLDRAEIEQWMTERLTIPDGWLRLVDFQEQAREVVIYRNADLWSQVTIAVINGLPEISIDSGYFGPLTLPGPALAKQN